MSFQPFQPEGDVHIHRQNLPHWRQWGGTYFVTARLGDSVPRHVAEKWRADRGRWFREHQLNSAADLADADDELSREYHRQFTARFHQLLDAGHGECLLRVPECGALLMSRIIAGHGMAYHLDAWVIMPNHVHVLIEPAPKQTLGEIVRHWKGGSAFDINRLRGRKGSLWQREAFDHIVRSGEQLHHFRKYIAENPAKARLRGGFVLGFGARAGVCSNHILNGGTDAEGGHEL
jgi:putative transposase